MRDDETPPAPPAGPQPLLPSVAVPTTVPDPHAVHKSSARTGTGADNWRTPRALFEQLDAAYRFELDAASDDENALCERHFVEGDGTLVRSWAVSPGRAVWLNPPYSRLRDFMRKAHSEGELGVTVVCLIPARTDTRAWHDFVMKSRAVALICGRVRFLDPVSDRDDNAPFPSALVTFGPGQGTPHFTSFNQRDPRQGGLFDD